MKLSANGIEKIHHNCRRMTYIIAGESGKLGDYTQYEGLAGAEDLEFEPDDFQGAVILTVEEAKRISMFFDTVDCCSSDIKLTEGEKNLWQILNDRIEQAEDEE